MRKELSRHTMSARSRTAAGPRERGWPRAVPEVFCERPPLQQPPTQSHSHPLLRSLPWSLFCVVHDLCSVSRRIASMFQFSRIVREVAIRLHVVSCFTAFSARQLSVETSVFASSQTQIRWHSLVLSVCLVYKHTNS